MTASTQRARARIVVFLAGALVSVFHLPCQARPSAQKLESKAARPKRHSGAAKSSVHTPKASRKRSRRASFRYHRAHLQMEPHRVREIQEALVRAGYLHEEPNGKWDAQTRQAMRQYQSDSGFTVTGLPEAKTLMKLGLGPHPLPAYLDSKNPVRSSTDLSIISGPANPPRRADQDNPPKIDPPNENQ